MSGVQDLSGTVLKGYQLEERLGSSSETAVYRATRDGAQWAVKVVSPALEPDDSLAERLRHDADVLANMSHPGILPIHDAGRSGRLTYAVTPLVRAPTLQDLMSRGRMGNEYAWRILSQLAESLDSVHPRGLVFRALKPGNILVDDGIVYLAEFGVASNRVGQHVLSAPTSHLATPQYLAPEQVAGREPDWQSDIYSMAVLVFELLTCNSLQGEAPAADVLRSTLESPIPSAHARDPRLPAAVDQVLSRGLAKSPEERQRTANQLLEELVNLPDEGDLPRVPAAKRPLPDDSMVAVLKRMGMPVYVGRRDAILNSYFAGMVRFAKEACGARWPEVAAASGLQGYLDEGLLDDNRRTAPVGAPSRLAGAIEAVFDLDSAEVLRQWGRLTTAYWIKKSQELQEGDVTYMKPFRLINRPEQKVEDTLYVFTRNLDRIRGERLTTWKRVDRRQFWLVQYDNLTAVGRRRPGRSCHFWTAALDTALRWGGLANDWVVDEAECGCVTGTFDCVFTIQQVRL
jgi:hypothetical protein